MATTPTKLMTFAEFERLPVPEGWRLELRHGELFKVAPPKIEHSRVQWRIRRLLESAAGTAGIVTNELGFRALREHEWRVADVAFVSKARWDAAKDYLDGAPEIVVEIVSPSNTAGEMLAKEKLCLENGCREFWLVDPELRLVKVSTPDGHSIAYHSGQEIPLPLLNGARLDVNAIFTPSEN